MEKLFRIIAVTLAFSLVSCQDFVQEIAELHMEFIRLQADVDKINTTTASIADIVRKMDDDFIVGVDEIIEDDICIGYSIKYKKGWSVNVYHGTDGKKGEKGDDGHNGNDGHSPLISIRRAADSVWYWTVDGEWMADAEGNKIPVAGENGLTPRLKIEKGRWMISYNGGITWEDYGEAGPSYGNSPILDVDYSSYENMVKFTLRDGTEFFVLKEETGTNLQCATPSVIEAKPGKVTEIGFRIDGGSNSRIQADVMAGDMFSWSVKTVGTDSCTVALKANGNVRHDDLFTVFINYGHKTWMKVFSVNLAEPDEYEDLSSDGTANCYIISYKGKFRFNCMVKGCTEESVGKVTRAEVLWETFGTSTAPEKGDIVSDVYYSDGYIQFTSGKDGNAVIAAKDKDGEILWSWHIWVCQGFYPEETAQEYFYNAGTMMDRNIGATSASPGDVKAFGLHYQWGRKDPFPGPATADSNNYAQTTLSQWPEAEKSSPQTGTISYATAHPTTYLVSGYDWLNVSDRNLWNKEKTEYDPCPNGWRVPDGGPNGVWAKAFNSSSPDKEDVEGVFSNGGMDYGSTSKRPIGNYPHIWYPVSGTKDSNTSELYKVSTYGGYWSCTSMTAGNSYSFYFDLHWHSQTSASLQIIGSTPNAYSHPVRCQAVNSKKQ